MFPSPSNPPSLLQPSHLCLEKRNEICFKSSTMESHSAIVLTPAGVGAIALIRLRGPKTGEFLSRHFSKPVVANRCIHGQLHDGEQILDDPVVVLAPDSSWADINLHGGVWIVESVLELCSREGFEIIQPTDGVFAESVMEGDSIIEREMLAELPRATTELALRALLAQPIAWVRGPIEPAMMLADRALWWLLHPPRVAIVGSPNVGKSTLANRLFGQERSITADVPGTTRDWVGEMANLDGLAVMLVDTPGARQSDDELEQAAIAGSREQINAADLLIVVHDVTHVEDAGEAYPAGSNAIHVMNKIDRVKSAQRRGKMPVSQGSDSLAISALRGDGIIDLIQAIHRHFGLENFDINRPRWWTARQRQLLSNSHDPRDILPGDEQKHPQNQG
jgi:small GTP-binding protein